MNAEPEARLPALGDSELPDALKPVLAAWPYRLHRTLAHSPASLQAWMPWAEDMPATATTGHHANETHRRRKVACQ